MNVSGSKTAHMITVKYEKMFFKNSPMRTRIGSSTSATLGRINGSNNQLMN